MGLIRESVVELFEIAGRDYFLAKAILKKTELKISFEELSCHCGSRNTNDHYFIEQVLDQIDESTLVMNELLKKIKEPVMLRSNVCIYLALKYKSDELTANDIFLFSNKNSWDKNSKMISEVADKIKLQEDSFMELMKAYESGNSIKRDLAEKMIMRLPITAIDYDFISRNQSRTLDYTGRMCRLLLLKHYGLSLNVDDVVKMYRKDYGNEDEAYLTYFKMMVATNSISKSFWENCLESGRYEIKELAHKFLHEYDLSESQKKEMEIYFNVYHF